MSSESRLTALLAALAITAITVFAVGCGSSETAPPANRPAEGEGEALTVGSDIPYPPVRSKANPATTPASTSN